MSLLNQFWQVQDSSNGSILCNFSDKYYFLYKLLQNLSNSETNITNGIAAVFRGAMVVQIMV